MKGLQISAVLCQILKFCSYLYFIPGYKCAARLSPQMNRFFILTYIYLTILKKILFYRYLFSI